ncbi:hypothetical protein Bca4012_064127 [Brassica carinata]
MYEALCCRVFQRHLLSTETVAASNGVTTRSKEERGEACLSGSQRDDARQGAWSTEESTGGEALAVVVRWRLLPSAGESHGPSGG